MIELLPVGHDRECFQADVHPDCEFRRCWKVGHFHLAQHRCLVVIMVNATNSDVQNLPLEFLLAFGLDPAELREFQSPVFDLNVAVRELRAVRAPGAFLLEVRETGSPTGFHRMKEVLVGLFKVAQRLLQRELISIPINF